MADNNSYNYHIVKKIEPDNDWTEHYIKKGDPSKPTYYIIRHKIKEIGLFVFYKTFAAKIKYALQKGYIPVIDMQNYPNIYLSDDLFGKENPWEYYFEQPLRIGLEDAYNGENIIIDSGDMRGFIRENMAIFQNKDNILTEWRMLVKMGLLKVKDNLMKEFTDTYNKLFTKTDRVLAAHMRGTDYMEPYRPHRHPIPPP